MVPTDGQRVARTRLQAACWLGMVVFAASVAIPGICLPQIGDEFGLALGTRGLLGSLRMAALLLALLTSGYLADRFGKVAFLTGGMALAALGLAGTPLARQYGPLLAAQAVVGLGMGAMEALINPLVAELHPDSPARPLNITNGLFSVGLVAAALLSGEMLEAWQSWRATFLVWVVPALVTAALFASRRYPRAERGGDAGDGTAFLRKPLFWALMGAMVIAGGCEAGMTFWSASFMEHLLGASTRGGAMTVAFFGAAMAAGRFATGGLVAKFEPLALTVLSAVGYTVATAGLCFSEAEGPGLVLIGLSGLFVACFWPTILAVATQRVQAGSTTMFALLAAAGISGCIVFPWAIGAIGDAAGLRLGVALLPAAMVIEGALLVAVWRALRDADRASRRSAPHLVSRSHQS